MSVMSPLCRPDFAVGLQPHTWETEMRGEWLDPGCWTPGELGMVTLKDSRVRAATRTVWWDLWLWLVDHGVPRNLKTRKPTKFLLHLYKQKSSRSSQQRPKWIIKAESHGFSAFPRYEPFYRPRTLWKKGVLGTLEKGSWYATKIYAVNLPASLLQRTYSLSPR